MKTKILDESTGEIVCGCGCGTVLEERLPDESYAERQKDSSPIAAKRTGQISTLAFHDQGLSTLIGNRKTDFSGNKIKIENLQLFYRLNQLNNYSIQSDDPESRKLIKPLQKIQDLGKKMGLPPGVIKQAQYLLHKCNSKKITQHHIATQVAAVCLYLACRISGAQRSMYEFVQISERANWGFFRLIQSILETLDLKLQINDPVKLIPIICREMHIDNKIEEFAIRILQEAQRKAWGGGKSPFGVAAAAIYLSSSCCGENKISSLKLAEVIDMSQASVSSTVRELEAMLS